MDVSKGSLDSHREHLQRIITGFQGACVLAAGADLQLFDLLTGAPRTLEQIAEALEADQRGCRILLDALSALEIIEKHDDTYRLPAAWAPLLRSDTPDSMISAIQHWANCQRNWARLAEAVKSGEPVEWTPSIRGPEADREAFIQAMHAMNVATAGPIIHELLQQKAMPDFTHVLDVGGASGTWTLAFLEEKPDAKGTIFDLPDAIELARERIGASESADRIDFASGDFYQDDLPVVADFAWVSAIIHQHGRADNVALFKKIFTALKPGGAIGVRDVVLEPSRTKPTFGALFAVNMLVHTQRGDTFTFDEIAEDLAEAGFADVRLGLQRDDMSSVVLATKVG